MVYSYGFFIFSVYAFHTVSSLALRDGKEGDQIVARWRRGKRSKPSAVLQFKPEYFDYPGLKDILSAVSSAKNHLDQCPKLMQEKFRKRQVSNDNEAAFVLRVNPVIPRNPLSVRNYSKFCHEKKTWCAELPTPKDKICPPVDTPTPIPSTCGPTKPFMAKAENVYCNFEKTFNPIGHDPCDECPTAMTSSTEYQACISQPAPTAFARMRLCGPTTGKCHSIPCTYRSVMPLNTEPPPTPPRCDVGSLVEDNNPDNRYYILVKRSPRDWRVKRSPGNWRAKRSRFKKRFRIVPDILR